MKDISISILVTGKLTISRVFNFKDDDTTLRPTTFSLLASLNSTYFREEKWQQLAALGSKAISVITSFGTFEPLGVSGATKLLEFVLLVLVLSIVSGSQ